MNEIVWYEYQDPQTEDVMQVCFAKGNYLTDNRIAVEMYVLNGDDLEPYATVSVWIDDVLFGVNETYLDTNNVPGILEFLTSIKAGEDTGYRGHSGFCEYPLFRFNDEFLKEAIDISSLCENYN